MTPDWTVMDAEVCGALAQIVPVLFIALLFEIRVRPDVQRTLPGIILGFLGNIFVATVAVAVEFTLLAGLQGGRGIDEEAGWVWAASIFLFGSVVLRWAATTAAVQLAANSLVLRDAVQSAGAALSEARLVFRSYRDIWQLIIEVLAAPSQVIVDVAAGTWNALADPLVGMIGGTARSIADVFTAFVNKLRR